MNFLEDPVHHARGILEFCLTPQNCRIPTLENREFSLWRNAKRNFIYFFFLMGNQKFFSYSEPHLLPGGNYGFRKKKNLNGFIQLCSFPGIPFQLTPGINENKKSLCNSCDKEYSRSLGLRIPAWEHPGEKQENTWWVPGMTSRPSSPFSPLHFPQIRFFTLKTF